MLYNRRPDDKIHRGMVIDFDYSSEIGDEGISSDTLLPGKIVILFAVSVTKVKCILRSKVLLQRQVKYITGGEKMK